MSMTRVILSGCCGRMGKVITGLVGETQDMQIVAGIDIASDGSCTYPVYPSFAECDKQADVVIDFSSPHVFDAMMDYCLEKKLPAVVCTTGLSEEQIARLNKASEQVAMLRSANMSLGINLLIKLLAQAVPTLAGAGFDIEIVEKHHNKKKDAPSGTALALAESINHAMSDAYSFVYNRSDRFEQRRPKEIGISAVRGGSIVGEHEVIFAGTDEVITFTHTAYSRAIFAKGAIAAAAFLSRQEKGLYDMQDVIA